MSSGVRHRRGRRTFALVMLDLDGFKALNDRFGHPAGDDLLRDVSLALKRAMRGHQAVEEGPRLTSAGRHVRAPL